MVRVFIYLKKNYLKKTRYHYIVRSKNYNYSDEETPAKPEEVRSPKDATVETLPRTFTDESKGTSHREHTETVISHKII